MTERKEKKLSIRSGSKVSFADKESAGSTEEKTNKPTGELTVTDGQLVSSSPAPNSSTSGGEGNRKPVVTSPESSMKEKAPEAEGNEAPVEPATPEKSRTL